MEASGFLSGGDAAGASAVPTTTTTTTVLEVPATIEENAAADLSSMPAVGAFNPSPFQSVENFVTFATDEAEVEIEQEGNVATFASASVPATPRVSVTWAATEVESIDAVTDAVTEYVPPSEVPSVVEVTLTLPPVVPEDEYIVRVPGKCLPAGECIGPLPEFTARGWRRGPRGAPCA